MEKLLKDLALRINGKRSWGPGLFTGEMGACLSLYLVNKEICDKGIEKIADGLLDKVVDSLETIKDSSFVSGITGIGWAINCLYMNNCIGGDIDDILYNIDAIVYKKVHNHQDKIDINLANGLVGYLVYVVSRLMNKAQKEDNLQKKLNEDTLKSIVDWLELSMPSRFPMMSKDLYPTLLWEFPILFYCLGKAVEMGIYKEKICNMCGIWSYYITSMLPFLNINRLAIANSLAYLNGAVKDKTIEPYIDTLFYSINFDTYIHEIKKDNFSLCGGWFCGMLNSFMAKTFMDRKHVRYPELDIIDKKIRSLYNKSAKESLLKMDDVQPNVAFVDGYSGALLAYSLFQKYMNNIGN